MIFSALGFYPVLNRGARECKPSHARETVDRVVVIVLGDLANPLLGLGCGCTCQRAEIGNMIGRLRSGSVFMISPSTPDRNYLIGVIVMPYSIVCVD